MKKRGQLTLFLILALSLVLIFGLVYYLEGYKKTKNAKAQAESANQNSDEVPVVKSFAENCIKKSAEDALFNRIGMQGGFVNPAGDSKYAEEGISNSPINPPTALFDDNTVPFYYEADCGLDCTGWSTCTSNANGNLVDDSGGIILDSTGVPAESCPPPHCVSWECVCQENEYLPDATQNLELIGAKLKHYIEAEFDNCFDSDIFKAVGIEVIRPADITANADVSLNAEDVTIKLSYPLTIKKDSTETKLDSFIVILPIRTKALYDSSKDFVAQVKGKVSDINGQTYGDGDPSHCMAEYDIRPHCQNPPKYDKNCLTNV